MVPYACMPNLRMQPSNLQPAGLAGRLYASMYIYTHCRLRVTGLSQSSKAVYVASRSHMAIFAEAMSAYVIPRVSLPVAPNFNLNADTLSKGTASCVVD